MMLKVSDVAKRLNCSIAKIYQLIESKRLQHYRCAGIRVSEEQLADYLASCSVSASPTNKAMVRPPRHRLKHIRL